MCLCKGTGGIKKVESWGISFNPCPDSHCEHDQEKAWNEYKQWRNKYFAELNKMQEELA